MKCRQCGFCCHNVTHICPNSTDSLEWIRARGWEIIDRNETFILVLIPSVCRQLKGNHCKLHNTGKKPYVCRVYPDAATIRDYMNKTHLDYRKALGPKCPFRKLEI